MNVAIFASAYSPSLGGVEEVCRQLAMQYQRQGIGVIVLTNRWPRSLPEYEIIDGIPVHRLPMRVAAQSMKSKMTAALTGAMVRRRMLEILRRFQPDVLHIHCVSANAAYALAAKQALDLPLVATLHGELTMDATQLFQRAPWAQRVLCQTLQSADAITACSRQTLLEAQAWYGKPFGNRATVVYNGICPQDSEQTVPHRHRRPYIFAIGRHVPQKGFDILLNAMAKLIQSGETTHDLILAGDGPELDRLKALAKQLNIADQTIFPGRVDHPTAMSLFAGSSFFVLPSRHEPFGIVNLEAMSVGRAVIATRVGGVPEMVEDGVNGILVESENAVALKEAMQALIHSYSLRSKLGAAGKVKAMQSTWPVIAEEYMRIYTSLKPAAEVLVECN